MDTIKDLNFYKNNCEEDYEKTPISVLRYTSELEQALQLRENAVSSSLLLAKKLLSSIIQADLNVIEDYECSDVVIRDLYEQGKVLVKNLEGNDC